HRWFAMPVEPNVLAAPTPGNRVLQIELLMGSDQLDEASDRIVEFRQEFNTPPWSSAADELMLKLEYQRCIQEEEGGGLVEARDRFATLAERGQDGEHPLTAAAVAAVGRLDHQLRQQESLRVTVRKFSTLGFVCAIGFALVGWFVWRDTQSSRLRRAEKQIKEVETAIACGDTKKRDESLSRAAVLLAEFPDNHLRASALRDRLRQPAAAPTRKSNEREFDVVAPESDDAVREILRSSTSIDDVPTCLQWLQQSDSDDEMRRDAIRWLRKRLAPSESLLPDELNRIIQYLRQTRILLPRDLIMALCELAALYWAGRIDEARTIAKQIDVTKLPKQGYEAIRLALGICLVDVGKPGDALAVLRPLRDGGELGHVATKWYYICAVSGTSAGRIQSKKPVMELVAKVLANGKPVD
ncbi:MAG: hypothetical protein ACC628_25970, partial [Pirellulaceae bacterium]